MEGVARQCGRSLQHAEQDLFFDEIETVRDVVLFLNAQPTLRTAA